MATEMRTQVKWWQFLAALIAMLATILTTYLSLRSSIVKDAKDYENHEQRIGNLETGFKEFKVEIREGFYKIYEKQDKQQEKQEQILIILQNKQDRKQF